ncbi:MAG: MoxR family ATPase [Bdellovibrionota bacterium]
MAKNPTDSPAPSFAQTLKDWTLGRAKVKDDLTIHLSERDGGTLHDKMRQAYWWIINNAIIVPHYDIAYENQGSVDMPGGETICLPQAMSYSSYVLIPLLTLFTNRKALMIGGPGRGKTTSSVIMALLAGMKPDDVRRSMLRGHPQLSISDLLGAPLPSELMKAEEAKDIKISWRQWITGPVKIIDEYNRIPTKTQSALLSLMADGHAEMFDQYVYAGSSAWFLTANDDAGGGTFQVIDALKDRIDVVVRAVPFNSGFIETLVERVESGKNPEDLIPSDIIFTPEELDTIRKEIKAVPIPDQVLTSLGFFLGQLDFCRRASPDFEYMSKDTLHLSGKTVGTVCTEACPLDKRKHLCTQTENGISPRAYLTALHFAKALAYFRGGTEVAWEDVRQIVPWVLHEKLKPNTRSPYFAEETKASLLFDRVAWIRSMIDHSVDQRRTTQPIIDQVQEIRETLGRGLEGVNISDVEKQKKKIVGLIQKLSKDHEFSGYIYELLQQLKAFYSRYHNYSLWLSSHSAK